MIKNITRAIIKVSMVVLFLLLGLTSTHAQSVPSGGGSSSQKTDKDFQLVPIPYINYNRSLGFSLGALPMAMYKLSKNDTISPSSISGALGMYTTNKTWFLMAFSKFFLDEDNWRVAVAGGVGSINFQFYMSNPVPGYIDYNTGADFAFLQVQRRLVDKLYLGVNYVYTKFNTTTEILPDTSFTVNLNGLGLNLSMDKRSNVYYPLNGYITELKYTTYPEFIGNNFVSNKIEYNFNYYFPFRDEIDVLAARFYAGLGIGDLSFNQQFVVGNRDIRGYTQGTYRGDYLLDIQGEYRWNFHGKWGAVGFAGLATIYGALEEEFEGILLPGLGVGIRYNVFPDNHMNVGIDAGIGRDDWGIYFRIGEIW